MVMQNLRFSYMQAKSAEQRCCSGLPKVFGVLQRLFSATEQQQQRYLANAA
jgi:hypothetical protein